MAFCQSMDFLYAGTFLEWGKGTYKVQSIIYHTNGALYQNPISEIPFSDPPTVRLPFHLTELSQTFGFLAAVDLQQNVLKALSK